MSESMVERVSRAICEVAGCGPVDRDWMIWIPHARAAIEALREPSEEMVRAAIRATDDELTDDQRDVGAMAVACLAPLAPHRQLQGLTAGAEIARDWQAMIDAALKEPVPTQPLPS